jgi:hypothetical protein
MDYYGYQQPGYGGMPPMGPMGGAAYGGPMMGPPAYPQGGYGVPYQAGFNGVNPNPYCMKCRGSGYRVKRNGKTKRCKCIKEQEKRMGRAYGFSSSDSD